MGTAYHSQYWAHALGLRGSGGNIESLSRSIANARVDLNPHQIDEDGTDDLRSPGGIDSEMLKEELNELRCYADLADSIQNNAKGEALIPALHTAFEHARNLGAARKAVIFTESRRTQDYLFALLSANGYEGQPVTINGSNSDPFSRGIYLQWVAAGLWWSWVNTAMLISCPA